MNTMVLDLTASVPPERRAALLLHGLPSADRAWVLGRLPHDQQAVLSVLLQELADLDPAGQELDADPSEVDAPQPCDPTPRDDLGYLEQLADEDLHRLLRQLGAAPPSLVALCLRLRPWPWRAQLLERLPLSSRERVRMLLEPAVATSLPGPRRAAALMRVLRRMAAPAPEPVMQSGAGPDIGAAVRPAVGGWRTWFAPRHRRTA